MKTKTAALIGPALDWAVAKCEGSDPEIFKYGGVPALRFEYKLYAPSTNWSQGGPIVEREKLRLDPRDSEWQANFWDNTKQDFRTFYAPTPLIAAMRCFVASRLGDEVEVPDELVQ